MQAILINFGIGVAASLVASLITHFVKKIIARKNDHPSGNE